MSEDRAWERIVDAVDTKFGLIKHGRSSRAVEDARDLTENVAFIVFERAGERYKLERVVGPSIVSRKTFGSRRIGSEVRFENTYDANDTTAKTIMYKQDGDDWTEISLEELGL